MRLLAGSLALFSFFVPCAPGQNPTGPFSISGTVGDPSGARIPGASLAVRQRDGSVTLDTRTDNLGRFHVTGLPKGAFEIEVHSDGFASQTVRVRIEDRSPAPLHIQLEVAEGRQEVTVSALAAQVSTDPADNLDVVSLDRQMLDDLPVFDQNYVGAMSQFLDPGSIGTGGVTLVVNGMEQKNIGVSASAIEQVKINQNPYSAEFSRPGRGRIEVITKPGSQSIPRHGQLFVPGPASQRPRSVRGDAPSRAAAHL